MRVLGVDPGLTRCGLGVVDGAHARDGLAGRARLNGDQSVEGVDRLILIRSP